MSSRPDLRLDWCSYEAAKYAVEHWHYSRTMPVGKLVRIGAWEDGRFIGCVVFGRGAASNIASPYGLQQTEVCELVRVALDAHATPVSRIIAIAIRMLKRAQPGLRLIVSFADSDQGHHGGIYQAGGWHYTGASRDRATRVHGKLFHPKTLHSKYGIGGQSIPWLRQHVDPNAENVFMLPKYKYVMPLDDDMRRRIAPLAKPYPKRPTRGTGETDSAPGSNRETGGASPTVPLLTEDDR
jgi:hypothetical protein